MGARKPKPKPEPLIPVYRLFDDGNAFLIIGRCRKAAKQAGWSAERIEAFSAKAKAGDYDHLIRTVMDHFEESDE